MGDLDRALNPAAKPLRVGVPARVSTPAQTCENQLLELRRYTEARGWQAVEYVDEARGHTFGHTRLDQRGNRKK